MVVHQLSGTRYIEPLIRGSASYFVSELGMTDTLVVAGTEYVYTVTAINALGEGTGSVAPAVTPTGVPGPPLDLRAVAGDSQVSLTWAAPASDGGLAITGYEVVISSGGQSSSITVSGNSYTDSGLERWCGTYRYTVAAINELGTGDPCSAQWAIPRLSSLPEAPCNLKAVASDGQVYLGWDRPFDGGSSIDGYMIIRIPGPFFRIIPGRSIADRTVENGVTYTYKVSAVTIAGLGNCSLASGTPTDVSGAVVPGVVLNLVAERTRSTGLIEVSWDPPADGGSSPVERYIVGVAYGAGVEIDDVTGTSYSCTYTDDNGYYTIWVCAVNREGAGDTTEVTCTIQN